MSPRHAPRKTPSPKRGRDAAFALAAVALLAGAAFLILPLESDGPASVATDSSADADPAAEVAAFAMPTEAVEAALAAAAQASAAGAAGAQAANGTDPAATLAALEEAHAALDAAIAAQPDILSEDGDPVELYLIQAIGSAWSLQGLDTSLPEPPAARFSWIADPSQVPSEDIAPPETGNATLDAALAEAAAAFEEVRALWSSAEVQALWDQLDETPVGAPGVARDPFGATGVVEPDEEGASLAQGHADGFLSTVDGGYGSLSGGLTGMLAIQQSLVADTQSSLAATDAFEADASAALDAELEARLQALADAATAYEEAVHAAATAYAEDVEAARAGFEAAAAAHAEAVQDASAHAVAQAQHEMQAQVAAVEEDAAARLAAIDAHEAALMAASAEGSASAADLEAYADAAAHARAAVQAQTQSVHDASAAVVADAQAEAAAASEAAEGLAAQATADAAAQADAALAAAATQEADLAATVEPALQNAAAHQARLHAQTQAGLEALADGHRARLVADAHELVGAATASADAAVIVVETVQADAATEVGKDLGYIREVAEDYAAAPTPEREARAAFWSEVHADLQGQQAATLSEGEAILSTAADVRAAAEAAGAGLATL